MNGGGLIGRIGLDKYKFGKDILSPNMISQDMF